MFFISFKNGICTIIPVNLTRNNTLFLCSFAPFAWKRHARHFAWNKKVILQHASTYTISFFIIFWWQREHLWRYQPVCYRTYGWDAFPIANEDWISLPDGGQLYELPWRRGIGDGTGDMRICEKGWAVAAFIPPAHTGMYMAAYELCRMHLPCHYFAIQL